MYHAKSSLPHLLPARAYTVPASLDAERNGILRSAWHFVTTLDKLHQPGDFVTARVLDVEVQIRNFHGSLKAYSNVCAHRHCLISSLTKGNSPSMRCQYHGWEYGEDGLSRKIPEAKDVAPPDKKAWQLPEYRVAVCGQLVFLSLEKSGLSLTEFLGPIASQVETRFSRDWKCYFQREFEYAANWKVAIENTLEAYHVASIHPETFGQSPGEQRSQHALNPRHTSLTTDLPFALHQAADHRILKAQNWTLKRLGIVGRGTYEQHHVFPNLLFSFTDAISLVHSVEPLDVAKSRSVVRQFGPRPSNQLWKRSLADWLGKAQSVILHKILKEDFRLLPSIQRGLTSSPHRGILSRSEERIHAFHQFLLQHQYQVYS
jgi:choline monooxygenase